MAQEVVKLIKGKFQFKRQLKAYQLSEHKIIGSGSIKDMPDKINEQYGELIEKKKTPGDTHYIIYQ